MTTKWEQVGVISVDAGLCLIGDPCYFFQDNDRPIVMGKDWHDFCNSLNDHCSAFDKTGVKQLNHEAGHAGMGFLVSTGWGDGVYPVEVKRDVSSNNRIAEVRVRFISEDE